MSGLGISRRLAPLAVVLAALPAAAGAGVAVGGRDQSRILVPRGARVDDYANAGYRLSRRGEEVYVEVDAAPLGSAAPFAPPRRAAGEAAAGDPVARLARAQTVGATRRYEAVSRILGWVSRNVEYRFDRRQPQSPAAVLERRSGYCTGVARLTVALLAAVGVEAREVAGYVADDGSGARARGYHRWIEVYYPDRGWVFSDPLTSHHYVPATYVRLASPELAIDRGLEGLLLERHDGIATLDLHPQSAPGVAARRNSARQLAASLSIRVEGTAGTGEVVLFGSSTLYRHPLVDGAATFVGLEPGRYQLRLRLPGGGLLRQGVELPDRRAAGLRWRLAEPGAATRLHFGDEK